MRYLISTTEVYRIDSEEDVKAFIESAKHNYNYELNNYSCKYKTIKAKGEVVDEYYQVTLKKVFTDEKEPVCNIDTVSYNSMGEDE